MKEFLLTNTEIGKEAHKRFPDNPSEELAFIQGCQWYRSFWWSRDQLIEDLSLIAFDYGHRGYKKEMQILNEAIKLLQSNIVEFNTGDDLNPNG